MSMFKRSFTVKDEPSKTGRWLRKRHGRHGRHGKLKAQSKSDSFSSERPVSSPIVTFVVSSERRFFAGHEHVVSRSPYFRSILRDLSMVGAHANKVVELPDEDPEIFSCVLEFLYKGDYYPCLRHNELENSQDKTEDRILSKATVFHTRTRDEVLRDTVVYCAADKYGLEDLKQLALRKQGLHTGIPIPIILRSARYAYENTPDSDADLRAHYLVMVIRAREMFKTSGTMEMEMEKGHAWFFDLFVSMCNHIDDLENLCKHQASQRS